MPQSAGGEHRTSDTAGPREEILLDGEFKIELDALRSHSNRGMHVFNNCGAVNIRGLLLSRQKRERPIFNNCGSVNGRGLLQPESTEEGEARLQQVRVGSRGLLKGLQT